MNAKPLRSFVRPDPARSVFTFLPRLRIICRRLWSITAVLGLAGPWNGVTADAPQLQISASGLSVQVQWNVTQDAGTAQLLKFQLQRSADLRNWLSDGGPIRSAATNQTISRTIERASTPTFYRLSVSPAEENSALAIGGEDVFGYGDAFAEALRSIGQISPEEFAARYSPEITYLPGLNWDATTAEFWPAFNVDPAEYNAGLVGGVDDLRKFDFRLNAAELETFKKLGFVVSERLGSSSCGEVYSRIWTDDLPVFITTDSVLHAWHRSYEMMLIEVERTILFQNFEQILNGMAGKIQAAEAEVNETLGPSLLDVDYYIAVARSLLAGTRVPSVLGQDERVIAALEAIAGERLNTCFSLFGMPRAVDFSQFKPRGHYADTNNYPLQNYFRCLMWLGRVDFRVAGGVFDDSDCTDPHMAPPRELGSAILMNWLLREAGQFDRWLQSERLIEMFVGWTDSMTVAQLDELLNEAGIQGPGDITDDDALASFQELLSRGGLGSQNIAGDYFLSPLGGPPAALPQSFTVFGQKFIIDSWALSEVVADRVIWDEGGQLRKVQRRVPSALDVAFGVLRNDQIVPELVARMTRADAALAAYPIPFRDGLPYQHNLAAVRTVVEEQPASTWNQNVYMNWLDVLRELSDPVATDPRVPDAMRTRAWAMKDLNTQLASWTELRHDTILYDKQSYTSGAICSYPKGFVEPRPEFWMRMKQMAATTAELISRTDYGAQTNAQTNQIGFLKHFSDAIGTLFTLSEKELRQEPFTAEEGEFISTTLVGFRGYAGSWTIMDGWYPKLFYRSLSIPSSISDGDFHGYHGATRWDALVTDIHTDVPCGPCGDPGSVLHEAVGSANLLLIAVNNGADRCVYAGPVLSHYEFELAGAPRRLTDNEWEQRLNAAGRGEMPVGEPHEVLHSPEWTREYLVPEYP